MVELGDYINTDDASNVDKEASMVNMNLRRTLSSQFPSPAAAASIRISNAWMTT